MRTMTTTKKKTKTKTTKTKTRRRRRQPGRETSAAGRRAPCPPSPPPLPPPAGTLVAAPPPPRGRRARACAAGGVAPAWHEGSGGATAATPTRRGLPPDRRGAGEGPTKPWRFRDAPKLGDQRRRPFQEHTPSLHRVGNSYVELPSFCGTAGPDIGVRPWGNPHSIWATGFWRGVVCTPQRCSTSRRGQTDAQHAAARRDPRATEHPFLPCCSPRPPPPACIPVVTIPPVPAEAPIRAVPLVAAPPAVVLVVAAPTAAVAAAAVPAAVVLALVTLAIIGATSPTSTRCFPASAPARWACWICRPLC